MSVLDILKKRQAVMPELITTGGDIAPPEISLNPSECQKCFRFFAVMNWRQVAAMAGCPECGDLAPQASLVDDHGMVAIARILGAPVIKLASASTRGKCWVVSPPKFYLR